jgi:hypothetical protein
VRHAFCFGEEEDNFDARVRSSDIDLRLSLPRRLVHGVNAASVSFGEQKAPKKSGELHEQVCGGEQEVVAEVRVKRLRAADAEQRWFM